MAKPTQADLEEFGTDNEVSKPCLGALIAALPEKDREAYRNKARKFIQDVTGRADITYRDYMLWAWNLWVEIVDENGNRSW